MSAVEDLRARLAGAMAMVTQKMGMEFEARRDVEAAQLYASAGAPVWVDDLTEKERTLDFAVLQRQQAAQEVTDLVADAFAEFGAAIDALRTDRARERAAERQAEAARRAEAAKWRGAMDRKLEQVGGRAMTAAGIAAAHDHIGD
jgi:hypothetical protein